MMDTAEWDARVADSTVGLAAGQRDEELYDQRIHLPASREECRPHQGQADAAATMIAPLFAENAALRRSSPA